MNVADSILAKGEDPAQAILYEDQSVTYGELRETVARVASGLLARGQLKGDRVGIFSENNPFFVSAYLGIIRAGLVAVPFQTEVSADAFSEIVRSTGIREIFVSNRYLKRMRARTEELGLSVLPEDANLWINSKPSPLPEIAPGRDLASLMFTSGSTGSPKGVMVSHRNIECNTRDIISYMGLNAEQRVMVVLPFSYCFGLSLLHTHLMAGASIVLNNQFRLFPQAVLKEMQEKECTGLAGVPSTYQILMRRTPFCSMSFPHLRWFQQAGGKLPNPCIQELLRAFPDVKFFLMYGQTEGTARLSYLPPERLGDKLGSIGKGLPSTRIEVLKPDGCPVAPCSDELGEIVAAGDNITLGYWNDPAESAKFFRNGKLHTGDIARVDADGFVFVVERERDMIKSGGNRISAKEVEDVIAELPEVTEVAVLGAPHDELGEAIKAFVVPARSGLITQDAVEAHCRKRLPSFKVPEEVILLTEMIHNGAGKILKKELRKLLKNGDPGRAPGQCKYETIN